MMVSNRNILLQVSIFGCHVSFRGCRLGGQILFLPIIVVFSGKWLFLKGNDPIGDTPIFH